MAHPFALGPKGIPVSFNVLEQLGADLEYDIVLLFHTDERSVLEAKLFDFLLQRRHFHPIGLQFRLGDLDGVLGPEIGY